MAGEIAGGLTGVALGQGSREYVWTSFANGETAEVASMMNGGADVGLHAIEVSGTATLTLEGTNYSTAGVPDNFIGLNDADGDAISLTASGIAQLRVVPKHIKPVITGTGVWHISLIQRG